MESGTRHRRRLLLLARETLSWFIFIPFAYTLKLLFEQLGRYRMENRDEIRAAYEALVGDAERRGHPVVFCANHLTFIDSILLLWVCTPVWRCIVSYRRVFWNVPSGDVFARSWLFRWICRLNKCIFVYRDGHAAHKARVLSDLESLLSRGSSMLLFPEGRRSRSGRVETSRLATGSARLALSSPEARLVCAYLRADRLATYASYPPRHSRVHVQLEEIEVGPFRAMPEREGRLALTQAIGELLLRMEEAYFAGMAPLGMQRSGALSERPAQLVL